MVFGMVLFALKENVVSADGNIMEDNWYFGIAGIVIGSSFLVVSLGSSLMDAPYLIQRKMNSTKGP